jgi:hypothetical protein
MEAMKDLSIFVLLRIRESETEHDITAYSSRERAEAARTDLIEIALDGWTDDEAAPVRAALGTDAPGRHAAVFAAFMKMQETCGDQDRFEITECEVEKP